MPSKLRSKKQIKKRRIVTVKKKRTVTVTNYIEQGN